MKNKKLAVIVEGGICIALAQILSYVKIFEMPAGGSVTAGSLIPIFIFAFRWGGKHGILAGVIFGVMQFIFGPKWSFHPISLIFDYPVAFGALGLAGFFRKNIKQMTAGIFLGIFIRFISHVISGVVVFASYAPEGQSPLLYSVIYNGSYLLPELIISLILSILISRKLFNPRNIG